MLMAASAIFAMNSCKEDTPVEELDGPSIEWESNSDFSTVDITETMDVNLTIKAPAGIKSFTVDVKSEALESVLGLISSNGSTLDLINDAQLIEGLKTMSAIEGYEGLADLPTGDAILDQTSIDFNISSLVPLILILTQNETEESLHEFTINVTDNNAKTATETCTFRRVASDTPSYAAPTMTWEGNESFDVEEIEEGMIVKFTINVPAGIESLVVDINSSALNPIGISSLDFVNVENNNDMLAGVVTGILGDQDITTATILTLDLSTLMPMLLKLPTLTPDSDHVFTVKLTDKAGQGLEQACTFHYSGPQYAAPAITWEGNESFGPMEIEEGMSVKLSIDVPAGIESLVVDINSAPLNSMGMTTIDFVNPGDLQTVVDMVLSGQDITTATSLTLDLSSLVPMLLILPTITPDSDHVFTVKLTDKAGQGLEQACTFHYSGPQYAAPAITWEGNESFGPMEIEEGMSVKLSIDVPAGIESLVVDINSAPLNSMGMTTIDFVNPGDLQTVVDMVLSGQDITTATSLTLDLSSLVPMLLILPTITPDSDHVFTVKLTDKAGQNLEQACTFHYTGE